ncbi:hypothetical protein Tco_1098143 [Tanacetum coccineum]
MGMGTGMGMRLRNGDGDGKYDPQKNKKQKNQIPPDSQQWDSPIHPLGMRMRVCKSIPRWGWDGFFGDGDDDAENRGWRFEEVAMITDHRHSKTQSRVGLGPEPSDPSTDPVINIPSADPPIGRSVSGKYLRPFNTIVADPCPTRDPLRPLLKKSYHFSCSSTKSSTQVVWSPDPTKDFNTLSNPTNFILTSGAIRGRNGPQGLEEPMSDEVLREMCDKNYHQLLSLIAEKMQKEKEQKDKLNAVKARLIYGEESRIKTRSRKESHYSKSKTPTARTEPRRRHGDRHSRSPSPHASVFKRLKKYISPSPRPRPQKKGGVFNRLGRKEPATSARSDSRQQSPKQKELK